MHELLEFLKRHFSLCQVYGLFSVLIQWLDNFKIQEQIIIDSWVDPLSLWFDIFIVYF